MFEGLGDSLLPPGKGRGETLPPSLEGLGPALAGPAAEAGGGGLGLHLLAGALCRGPSLSLCTQCMAVFFGSSRAHVGVGSTLWRDI